MKSRLIGKDPDAGKDRGQEEKGATEDETVGWHHRLSAHEFEQTPGDSEGQGSLTCCSPCDRRSRTELSNNNVNEKCVILNCQQKSSYRYCRILYDK